MVRGYENDPNVTDKKFQVIQHVHIVPRTQAKSTARPASGTLKGDIFYCPIIQLFLNIP